MADEIERFQSHQAMLEADRIQRIRQQLTGISALFCDDCGAPVPAERRRLIPWTAWEMRLSRMPFRQQKL
ncbi:hypothetical protein C3445_22060 [Escherichia coli]|uniref:TraR/DksA C4-type zinc finger protein n=1 Tax=Escherichia coli TaxID=562 RepID=UPI000F559D4F|nr:TraR/DksA C4-type zinc finger protein [Escherichia coli]RQN47703.1 hypothetical protein C3445_22060 [Escherichia coli]